MSFEGWHNVSRDEQYAHKHTDGTPKSGVEELPIRTAYHKDLQESIAEDRGYDYVGAFTDGVARARMPERGWFVVDTGGRALAGPYAEVRKFAYGRTFALKPNDSRWYLIDRSGAQLAGPYERVGEFADGRAQVLKDHTTFEIDTNGRVLEERQERKAA